MKSKGLILLVMLISSGYNFGQEFYIRLHSGYGIGVSTQAANDYTRTETAQNAYSYAYKAKNYSYGNGTYFSAAFGYFMNSNIGFDLELQYLNGSSYPLHNEYIFLNSTKQVLDYENYATAYMINPSVVLRTSLASLKPYLKIGPVISFGTINNNYTLDYPGTNNTRVLNKSEVQYSGGVALGLNAAIGTSYEVYRKIDLFVELNSKNLSYAPSEGEVKKYLVNGVEQLQQLSVASRKMTFQENVSVSSSQNMNVPTPQPITYYPFSSLTFSLGISFTL